MNTDYTYDEKEQIYHGSSFSNKFTFENSPAKLVSFYPGTEKSSETSGAFKLAESPSTEKSKNVHYAPELTLDDLREKLKVDGKNLLRNNLIALDTNVRKTINFENSEKSPIRTSYTDQQRNDSYDNRELVYSISSLGG